MRSLLAGLKRKHLRGEQLAPTPARSPLTTVRVSSPKGGEERDLGRRDGDFEYDLLYIPSLVLDHTELILRQAGAHGDEGFAVWAGTAVDGHGFVSTLVIPQASAGPTHGEISAETTARLLESLDRRDLVPFLQIHSHPREAFLSKTDAIRPLVAIPGFISIIVPDFGFVDMNNVGQWSVHEMVAFGRWRELDAEERQRRFIIDDSVIRVNSVIEIVPLLHDLVGSSADRNLVQLREWGVDESTDRSVRLGVRLGPRPTPGRVLLCQALVDFLLRLDPLVSAVVLDAPDLDDFVQGELVRRLPLQVGARDFDTDFTVGVGPQSPASDLLVDAAGWTAAIGQLANGTDDANPVGPFSAAAMCAAEVFKWAFDKLFPVRAHQCEMESWTGQFSLFSYEFGSTSPLLGGTEISTTLIGAGGVGAGFIRTIGALGPNVSGTLDIVDHDTLGVDSLNRVAYATVEGAKSKARKVDDAIAYLRARCPNLQVGGYPELFDGYKQRVQLRADRLYDVAVTALDDDEVRWEVQRDLPRILIDGSTGRDLVARVERVEFGQYGCLGCTRRPAPARPNEDEVCDQPIDPYAPSLSFLSAFPGILAAGEVLKEAMGGGSLRGNFDHVFRYGPNPELKSMAAIRGDCQVGCGRTSKLAQFNDKYPGRIK